MAFQILVVEDDLPIANLIEMTLRIKQHDVTAVHDGNEAYRLIQEHPFDLALLDVMLPGRSGYELIHALKERGTPTIFLSAKGELSDRVYGLNLGAEDYIVKPFEPLELIARVDVALRRIKPDVNRIQVADLSLDTSARTVTKAGQAVELTRMEYDLLEFLMRHPNMVFSREQLLERIWGYDYEGTTRTVDMHIKNLRAKLGLSDYICTVYKIGYKLVEKVD